MVYSIVSGFWSVHWSVYPNYSTTDICCQLCSAMPGIMLVSLRLRTPNVKLWSKKCIALITSTLCEIVAKKCILYLANINYMWCVWYLVAYGQCTEACFLMTATESCCQLCSGMPEKSFFPFGSWQQIFVVESLESTLQWTDQQPPRIL